MGVYRGVGVLHIGIVTIVEIKDYFDSFYDRQCARATPGGRHLEEPPFVTIVKLPSDSAVRATREGCISQKHNVPHDGVQDERAEKEVQIANDRGASIHT